MPNQKKLKNYKYGITIGILSIISALMLTGVPIGISTLELVCISVYLLGIVIMLILSLKKKNDKISLIYTLIYIVVSYSLIAIVEMNYNDYKIYAIGWILGFVLSAIGLVRAKSNEKVYNIKLSLILNIIGMILSLISLFLVIPNGGFVIN